MFTQHQREEKKNIVTVPQFPKENEFKHKKGNPKYVHISKRRQLKFTYHFRKSLKVSYKQKLFARLKVKKNRKQSKITH